MAPASRLRTRSRFALWSAARHLACYEDALWNTAGVSGTLIPIVAIVGGIVALYVRTGRDCRTAGCGGENHFHIGRL